MPQIVSGIWGKVRTDDIIDRAVTRAKLSFDTLWKVARVDVTSDVTQVDFTGLDGDSDGLYILVFYIKNSTANDATCGFRFNDDTGTNYNWQEIHGAGTSTYANSGSGVDNIKMAHLNAGKENFGVYWIYPKTGQMRYLTGHFADTGNRAWHMVGWWTNTADNITKISIVASATGAISAGSWFILYKLGL